MKIRRYFRKNGTEYLYNGKTKVRVQSIKEMTAPLYDGMVIKIMVVQEVIRSSPTNPIQSGNVLAIAFPAEKYNAHTYEWKPGSVFQVPLRIKLDQPNIITPESDLSML